MFSDKFILIPSHLCVFKRERVCVRERESVSCLLYTSDAADESPGVDLGGRRIIKKIF